MNESTEIALTYLHSQQREDGGFLSLSSPSASDFDKSFEQGSVFLPACILSCLARIEYPASKKICDQLTSFLLAQRSAHWSFNYWLRGSRQAAEKPYPDDLDDTFCALAALTLYKPELIDAPALASIVTLLTSVEEQEGGPYRTWLVPTSAAAHWQDVDLAVNSNVAYFLSLHEIDLPHLVQLVETAIDNNAYTSIYYPSEYPVIYFISRFYRGHKADVVIRQLLAKKHTDNTWGNPLDTALAVVALLNFAADPAEVVQAVSWLTSQQDENGSWPAAAFCLDPVTAGQPHYAGSAALTTAVCLEALHTYAQALAQREHRAASSTNPEEQRITRAVTAHVRSRLAKLDPPLQSRGMDMLTTILKQDNAGQITRLPWYMQTALGSHGQHVPEELVVILGQIGVYGWMAYTIYDDFFDDEGLPAQLAIANVNLREASRLLTRLETWTNGKAIASLGHSLLDGIDAANLWELEHCRLSHAQRAALDPSSLPDYGDLSQLARKSMGHALGPAALLLFLGYSRSSAHVRTLLSAFEHFIIARQLNDDAHDWLEDLRRGHVNAVAAQLLGQYCQSHPAPSLMDEQTMLQLQEFFWQKVIESVCKRVLHHTAEAQKLFCSIPAVERPETITRFFYTVAAIATQTLAEREQTLEFIHAYSTPHAAAGDQLLIK